MKLKEKIGFRSSVMKDSEAIYIDEPDIVMPP
jgi:hypothetical protein